ncbi:hypothetical protein GCM10009678_72960 [Actinomadura kijaniata]
MKRCRRPCADRPWSGREYGRHTVGEVRGTGGHGFPFQVSVAGSPRGVMCGRPHADEAPAMKKVFMGTVALATAFTATSAMAVAPASRAEAAPDDPAGCLPVPRAGCGTLRVPLVRAHPGQRQRRLRGGPAPERVPARGRNARGRSGRSRRLPVRARHQVSDHPEAVGNGGRSGGDPT